MDQLLKQLTKITPGVKYRAGEAYFWSPKDRLITFPKDDSGDDATWALLHEAAHALLDHTHYSSDLELLLLEVAAWEKAKDVAKELGMQINEEHIQDCLDTYRDWLHQRSTCPRCSIISLQVSAHEYRCHNCNAGWRVSTSRFCRPYRLSNTGNIKSRSESSQATFI